MARVSKFRGVDMTQFNEKQIQAIELLALPQRGGLTYKQVADKVGISERQFHRWKNDPEFKMAVANRALENLYDDIPEVFNANLSRAKAGEVRSVELLYKLLGLLVDKKEIEVTETKGESVEDLMAEAKQLREELKAQGIE